MKKLFLLVLIVLFSITQNAVADGGFVPSDLSVYYRMAEDQQIVVIDVQNENNVNVDMFISITDNSTESHEIVFFLPFYEKPKGFEVEEKDYDEFSAQKTAYLDRFVRENSGWKDYAKDRIALAATVGWFISGGPSFLGILYWQMGISGASSDLASPEEVMTTEHTRVEVYNVTSERDLEELLSKADVPTNVKNRIRVFGGTYLYFITLKTIPVARADGYGRNLNSLGVHFSFQTEPKDGVYTYPLSTGNTWHNPIPLTRVYVRNPRDVSVKLEYPKIGTKAEGWDYHDVFWMNRYPSLDEKIPPRWDMDTADDPNFRVNRITYLYSNPDEDIWIKIDGKFGFIAFMEKFWVVISRFIFSIILPLLLLTLPLLFWFLYFRIFIVKLVQYPSRLGMYLNALLYFIINSVIQTSLSWMTLLFFFVIMIVLNSLDMGLYTHDGILVYVIILIPAILIPMILGVIALSFIFKLHNKLERLPLTRFLATYFLTVISHAAIALVAYLTL
jgi:hypothetical protein